jgi:hypothetical protein
LDITECQCEAETGEKTHRKSCVKFYEVKKKRNEVIKMGKLSQMIIQNQNQ